MATFLERLKEESSSTAPTRRQTGFLRLIYDTDSDSIYAFHESGIMLTHTEAKELMDKWQKYYQQISSEQLAEENREQELRNEAKAFWSQFSSSSRKGAEDGLVWLVRRLGDEGIYKIRFTTKYTSRNEINKLPHTPHSAIVHIIETNDVRRAILAFQMVFDSLAIPHNERPDDKTWYRLTQEAERWFKPIAHFAFENVKDLLLPSDYGLYESLYIARSGK